MSNANSSSGPQQAAAAAASASMERGTERPVTAAEASHQRTARHLRRADDEEDDWPGRQCEDTDTDDDENIHLEAEKDPSSDECEEVDEDGNLFAYKGEVPTEAEQVESLLKDPRWQLARARFKLRLGYIIDKATINALSPCPTIIDMSVGSKTYGKRENNTKWMWVEDPEGTHKRVQVTKPDGKVAWKYTKLTAEELAEEEAEDLEETAADGPAEEDSDEDLYEDLDEDLNENFDEKSEGGIDDKGH